MPAIRTRHVVFMLGAAVAVAVPLSAVYAQQLTPQQLQQIEEEKKKRREQQERQQQQNQQQGGQGQRPGWGQQPGGQRQPNFGQQDDDRRRGEDRRPAAAREQQQQQPPGGQWRRENEQRQGQNREEDDRRRGEDRRPAAREQQQQQPPSGGQGRRENEPRQGQNREEDDRRRGGDDDRRRGDDRRPGQQPGGGQPPQLGQQPPQPPAGGQGRREEDQRQGQDRNKDRNEDDRRRGDDRRPGQQPGGGQPPQLGQQPPQQPPSGGQGRREDDQRQGQDRNRDRNEDDRRRGDDRRPGQQPGGGQPPQLGQQPPLQPPANGQGRREDDQRQGQDRDKDRDRDRNRADDDRRGPPDGGRRFEAMRPAPAPEDVRRNRDERRQFWNGRLGDVVKQRRQEKDERGRTVTVEPDNRIIIRGEGGRAVIRHDETSRFSKWSGAREERGPGNSKVVIINRPGGWKLRTEADERGRLIRRVRVDENGREYVLIDNRDRGGRHRRGERRGGIGFGFYVDLPEPVIRIPRERYYVYADRASDDEIEDTLSAPPVEDIEPEYSLDEIRESPRLRERMRSVNLNTINFESGSWEVAEDQVGSLSAMAKAIERILRRNPDEVFMIEGHTDAVGPDEDNLSLSDRRAESVARVLSDEFNIPPENLVTQGYGEQHLLVSTDASERANRRVEFRRITPLLARGEQREGSR